MQIIIETKFDVGDNVKVIDNGSAYTTHDTFAKKHGLDKYSYNKPVSHDDVGVIVACDLIHASIGYCDLIRASIGYGVQRADGTQFIIAEDGVKHI